MKTLQLKRDLFWAGVLDKDLRVFDIIMYTEFGTTYNSYILKCGDKTVLFETAKEKFYDEYRETLTETLDIKSIDYIVVNHTEPDHAGSIAKIVEENPSVKIIATPTAISFLKHIVNGDFYSIPVKTGDELQIGDKTLRFFALPNLHWPDSMYTYVVEDKVLFTCDSFGSHYAHEGIIRSTVTDHEGYLRATKYYYDNILGPFKQPYMDKGLDVVRSLDVDMICPGHGPVLDSQLEELFALYEEWGKVPSNEKTTVVVPYVSAYGYTAELAEKVAEGVKEAGDIEVKLYDMVTADAAEVAGELAAAEGILFGSPTILGEALKPIWDLATGMYPPIHGGKLASAFGSYGWSGEAVPNLVATLKQKKLRTVDGFRVRFKPSEKELEEAVEFGFLFGLKLLGKEAPAKKADNSGLVKCLVCGEVFDASVDICPVCGVGPANFVPVESNETSFRKEEKEKVVILGGGTAALNAAKAVRQRNASAEITMISEEKELPYDRPMLTKNMFGAITNGAIASESEAWYKENNITLLLNSKVVKIDPEKKEVLLGNGAFYGYDKCVYALGSTNFIPPIKGKELPQVVSIRSIDDVEYVRSLSAHAKNAVVIGGGVLGLEAAWELRKAKLDVTVLEVAPVLMAGRVDSVAVKMLTDIAAKQGIAIKTGAKIAEISGEGKVEAVLLESGEVFPADIVVVSAGVRANIGIAKDAGLETDRAVIVNERMETNIPGIYAAGDCAQYNGANITIWPVASEMGRVAGANVAGEETAYVPEISGMTFAGFKTMLYAIGDVGTKADYTYKTLEVKDEKKETLERYYFHNNILCGAILIGDTSRMGEITEGIKAKKTFKELF